jgi:hypothetical protein
MVMVVVAVPLGPNAPLSQMVDLVAFSVVCTEFAGATGMTKDRLANEHFCEFRLPIAIPNPSQIVLATAPKQPPIVPDSW